MKALPSQISRYLEIVQKNNCVPNFWMSEEYINKADLIYVEIDGLWGFGSKDILGWFFPPWDEKEQRFEFNVPIYAGFVQPFDYAMRKIKEPTFKFLDHQFIYNPIDFQNLKGHKWGVFRKNIKKYPNRIQGKISYRKLKSDEYMDKVNNLLLRWAGDKTIQDNEVMISYVMNGENRWGLFLNDSLIGLNVFDENFKFINFRFCIDNGEPFLNEYLRYAFYTSEVILDKQKLVNDGGSLDNENLAKFKMKLNPARVDAVFSYER